MIDYGDLEDLIEQKIDERLATMFGTLLGMTEKEPRAPYMMSIDQYNEQRAKFWEGVHFGKEILCVACPECGKRLWKDRTHIIKGDPPKVRVECSDKDCEWAGTVLA